MGFRIAITGLLIAAFFLFMGSIAKRPPEQRKLMGFCGLIMIIGLFMIPFGLIIQTWQ